MKDKHKSYSELEKPNELKTKIVDENDSNKSQFQESNEYSEYNELEHEIDCPRCKDIMTLCSELDSLYYLCYNCDFYLYAIK